MNPVTPAAALPRHSTAPLIEPRWRMGMLACGCVVSLLVGPGCDDAASLPGATGSASAVPSDLQALVLEEVPLDVPHRHLIDFEGKASLVGYGCERAGATGEFQLLQPGDLLTPGSVARLRLYWQSRAPIGRGWQLATYWLDHKGAATPAAPDAGLTGLRGAGAEGRGLSPDQWMRGRVYLDEQLLTVPHLQTDRVSLAVAIEQRQQYLRPRESSDGSPAGSENGAPPSDGPEAGQEQAEVPVRLRVISGPVARQALGVVASFTTEYSTPPATDAQASPPLEQRRTRPMGDKARRRRPKGSRPPELR